MRSRQCYSGSMPKRLAGAVVALAVAACAPMRRVTAGESIFCRESRRPFRAPATVWSQTVQVLRTSDGATRLTIPDDAGLAVTDFDADCDDPRASRRLPSGEAIASAVARLLTRV